MLEFSMSDRSWKLTISGSSKDLKIIFLQNTCLRFGGFSGNVKFVPCKGIPIRKGHQYRSEEKGVQNSAQDTKNDFLLDNGCLWEVLGRLKSWRTYLWSQMNHRFWMVEGLHGYPKWWFGRGDSGFKYGHFWYVRFLRCRQKPPQNHWLTFRCVVADPDRHYTGQHSG